MARLSDAEYEDMMCELNIEYEKHAMRAIAGGVACSASLTASWIARLRGATTGVRVGAVLGAGAWCGAVFSYYRASKAWNEMCLKYRS